MSDTIRGGCLCGAVRYSAKGAPLALTLCRCRTCRRAVGGPSVAWVVLRADGFRLEAGKPAEFRSSDDVERTFCSRCGTSLTYRRDSRPDRVDVTAASLDVPDDFAPTWEIWTAQKLSWAQLNGALAHHPESSRAT